MYFGMFMLKRFFHQSPTQSTLTAFSIYSIVSWDGSQNSSSPCRLSQLNSDTLWNPLAFQIPPKYKCDNFRVPLFWIWFSDYSALAFSFSRCVSDSISVFKSETSFAIQDTLDSCPARPP